jgi:transglutaminase-like putative cysteine protease
VFFEITHTTSYTFDRPVFLEPHTLRLRPRCDGSQRVIQFKLDVEPRPAGLSECLDVDGNAVTHAWFDGLTESLTLRSVLEVETLRPNPFDYILADPTAERLPMVYPDALRSRLMPYGSGEAVHDLVAQFARSITTEAGHETLPFLTTLTQRIQGLCQVTTREEGDPQPPEVTLAERRGACRDLTVLFMGACRALGIASRFVSGYQEGDPDQEERPLHAWAEVYLPGGGWRGYDPTCGLAVANRHVAVAAGLSPRDAAPVTGTTRGTGASSRLRAEIHLRASHIPFR